jgi:hypothetical protein
VIVLNEVFMGFLRGGIKNHLGTCIYHEASQPASIKLFRKLRPYNRPPFLGGITAASANGFLPSPGRSKNY